MTALIQFAIALAAILLGGLFSGFESAALTSDRLSLHPGRAGRTQKVRDIYRLLARTQTIIYSSRIGNTICSIVCVFAVSNLIADFRSGSVAPRQVCLLDNVLTAAVVIPLFLIFSVLVPKKYFRRHSRSLILDAFRPLLLLFALFVPPARALLLLMQKIFPKRSVRTSGLEKVTREDLKQLIGETNKPGRETAIDKRMIYGIFDLEQTIVREIMQPLVNLVAVERKEATLDRVITLARDSGFSTVPVYTRRIVNIDGVINILSLLRSPEPRNVFQHVSTPRYVPETMRADKLMRKMITDKIDLAVVVDEFGGTVGVVTREDVLEEIVGEIEDEFDPTRPTILPLPDGSFLIDGRMDIDNVNERFQLRLPNEDYDTLGGFIYDELGRIPKVGDVIEKRNLRLEVMSMDGKQIERVKLHVEIVSDSDTTQSEEEEHT
jgi:CBS domain containing-hemolysin-like protein